MTKKELIGIVAGETGVTKKDTRAVFNAIFSHIQEEMGSGGKIVIAGFGTFETADRKCRSPDNGISEMTVPVFRAGENLRRICRKE